MCNCIYCKLPAHRDEAKLSEQQHEGLEGLVHLSKENFEMYRRASDESYNLKIKLNAMREAAVALLGCLDVCTPDYPCHFTAKQKLAELVKE